ncbi:MAG: ATP-dependent RNA helicase HrpA [Desulfobulbaceae bacterium]
MHISYPPELPIASRREEIVRAVAENRVVVVAGDTGSGKTTQLPKMCLEAGRGKSGLIGCTQPRRIAAVSVAERVAFETGDSAAVGYKIRFHDHTGKDTRVKFMTDGVLLAETRGDRDLRSYDTIIIDEAHERSLNIDFLLGYLKTLLARRDDLKLLISSATLDTEKFSAHFDHAPIITVSGRSYPIDIEYTPPEDDDDSHVERAAAAVLELAGSTPGGDILVFLPTERDILDCAETVGKKLSGEAEVLPLFGRLQAKDQRRIFLSFPRRKIIIATNIAETSLTVPGIRYVVDSGLARVSRYNPRAGTTSLLVSRISRASCDQRAGRCGRTGPGRCIRLYSEEDYASRDRFTRPEIQRSNLAEVILQMISLRLGEPREFPFIDPPTVNAVRDGYRVLRELGALTAEHRLTDKGRIMASLPLDPRLSRIIIEGAENNTLREIKVIVAGLSIQDPRIRPLDQEQKADAAHRAFEHEQSDFLTLLNIWDGYHSLAGKSSASKLKKFCKSNYLSWQRMREWRDIHEQITSLLRGRKRFRDNARPGPPDAIHRSLVTGLLRNIALRREKNIYQAAGGREVMLFPGSALFNRGGQWIVAASFMETGRLYAMTAATIDVRWLEEIGGSLCRKSWSDPHWEKRSGRVVALERVTLFGLTIVAGRKVAYGPISEKTAAEAREIFLREALVGGELGGRHDFFRHNIRLIKRLRDMEHRTRRRDILADEETIYAFYDTRLGMVYDRHTLEREIKKHRGDRFLRMTEEDLLSSAVADDELYRFPRRLRAGGHSLTLHYLFEPGSEADGVTVQVPSSLVHHLSPSLFEWLVPGLLEEKITALLKGLPKQLRRRLVPLPETAAFLMDTLELYQGSLYEALERAIFKRFQLRIRRRDWQPDKLPIHLKMRFRLVDDQGRELATTRSFHDLAGLVRKEGHVSPDEQTKKIPVARDIRSWEFSVPPAPVPRTGKQGKPAGFLFPMLVIDREHRCLELHHTADPRKSERANREGLRYLFTLQVPREIKDLERECKAALSSHTASWLALGTGLQGRDLLEQLRDFLLDAIFAITPELPDKKRFDAALAAAKKEGIVRTGRRHLVFILDLLSLRREVLGRIEQFAAAVTGRKDPRADLSEEFRHHLESLVPVDFLASRTLDDLRHAPRYLKGLAVRMERAALDPAKDRRKAKQVAAQAARLASLPANLCPDRECAAALAAYRELVEEFRISVFAPELGTACPVSEKRLKAEWRKVENVCLRVE